MMLIEQLLPILLIINYSFVINAEIRTYNDITLPSSSSFVSYTEGYIMAPGSVNLVDLRFESFKSFYGLNDDIDDDQGNNSNRFRRSNVRRRVNDGDEEDNDEEFIDMGNDFEFESGADTFPEAPGPLILNTTSMLHPSVAPSESMATPFISSDMNMTEDEIVADEIELILNSTDDDELVEEEIEQLLDNDEENNGAKLPNGTSIPSLSPTDSSSIAVPSSNSPSSSVNVTGTDVFDEDDFDNRHDHDDASKMSGNGEMENGNSNGNNELPPVANAVELILFAEPEECSNTREGCDWTTLGIGASNHFGDVRWCCSEDAYALGFCDATNFGKLIIQHELFQGSYATVHVPKVGYTKVGNQGLMKTGSSGNHILIIANCGLGENVVVRGKSIWTSVHGFLPGDLWGEFEFFAVLTFLYALILTWYGWKMHIFSDFTIPIQKWLLVTLLAGFIEVLFKAGDYWIWNEDGTRFDPAMYIGIFAGVVKRSISRALVLMVCFGWGVVRASLGGKMKKIIIFLCLYVVTSSCRDVFTTLAITDPDLTTEEEGEVVDIVAIFTFATAALDVLIYLWIIDAINATIDHLETMSQHQKLKIMLRLRLILILSILFAVFWSIFGVVNLYMDKRILDLEQEWAVKGAWEVNYLFVLISIAFLWRPNERAKELAYAIELPSASDLDEVEFDTNAGLHDDDGWGNDNEHDFSLDDDEEDGFDIGEYGNGLRVEDGEHT